jgi:acetolactate synthase small subunit
MLMMWYTLSMAGVTYTLTLLVRDAPGVLEQVAQVFAKRECNINSIHVLPHQDDSWSNMIITTRDILDLNPIVRQLEKLAAVKSVHTQEDFIDS